MNTSFDNAVAAATQPNSHVEAVKQTFAPALAALYALKRDLPTKKSSWLGRLATIQTRVQPALQRGVCDPDITRDLEDLTGGRGISIGLIASAELLITAGIQKMEAFGALELPHRTIWLAWPSEPQRVRDNFAGIERTLKQLEDAVKDGGRLEQRLNDKAAQRGTAPLAPAPQRPATGPKVESEFTL